MKKVVMQTLLKKCLLGIIEYMENVDQNKKKTKILCIFDGFGIGSDSANNCISRAKMPNFRRVLKEYYWTTLNADGQSVGQEAGLVGNSEVGHLNIGGLQLVQQLSYQITQSAEQGFGITTADRLFDPSQYLKSKFEVSKNSTVHLIGLFSTGTIHSDMRHWIGAIEAAGSASASRIVLHLISDGRDSDRSSLVATWQEFINRFELRLRPFISQIFLGSVGGRFFAMDRDKNWERTIKGILPMFEYKNFDPKDQGQNKAFQDFFERKYGIKNQLKENRETHFLFDKKDRNNITKKGLLNTGIGCILEYYTERQYEKNIFDENLEPSSFYYILPQEKTRTFNLIQKNDTIWLLNFRSDRMKQFATLLCDLNSEFSLSLDIISMNDYGIGREVFDLETANYDVYKPIFQTKQVQNTLAETISNKGQTQLHIAETEKYAHITYFFNGGREIKHQGEDWVLIPSNKVESHADQPEMKAKEITDYILDCLDSELCIDDQAQISSGGATPLQRGQSLSSGGFSYVPIRIPYNKKLKEFASEMRQNQTKAEMLVWNNILKADRFGFRFIRQKPLLDYIVDFYCFDLGLIIEIDGDSHNYSIEKDKLREQKLAKYGLNILRFSNSDVYSNLDGVKLAIKHYIDTASNPPKSATLTPSKRGGSAHQYDYIIVNYANPDMVGHTGDILASIKSMEFLDTQFGRLLSKVETGRHSLILIADHGNMEFVGEYTQKLPYSGESKSQVLEDSKKTVTLVDTEHNPNAVPCIIVDSRFRVAKSSDKGFELQNQNEFLTKVENLNLKVDRSLLQQILKQKNYQNLDDKWMTEQEIENTTKVQLPLWYVGVLLLGL